MTKKIIKKLKVTTLKKSKASEIKNASIVFEYALNSVNEFYSIYQNERDGSSGSSTHQEQDLLRAMLVFSCSGLDAVVKQLIKDSLPKIIQKDLGAQKEFQKFVERRLKKTSSVEKDKIINIDTAFLSQVLVNSNPKNLLMNRLTEHLIVDSLQNKDQLLKVAAYFAITSAEVLSNDVLTKEAFDARNNIIHEMDVNFKTKGSGQKKRNQRSKTDVLKYCENIFSVASNFINIVSSKLNN